MECPDGKERLCFPLLAFHVCDHVEALKATLTKKTVCTACNAEDGQLHYVGCSFSHKKSSTIRAEYEEQKVQVTLLHWHSVTGPIQVQSFTNSSSIVLLHWQVGVLDDNDMPFEDKTRHLEEIEDCLHGIR